MSWTEKELEQSSKERANFEGLFSCLLILDDWYNMPVWYKIISNLTNVYIVYSIRASLPLPQYSCFGISNKLLTCVTVIIYCLCMWHLRQTHRNHTEENFYVKKKKKNSSSPGALLSGTVLTTSQSLCQCTRVSLSSLHSTLEQRWSSLQAYHKMLFRQQCP